jgi:hypothetical protein
MKACLRVLGLAVAVAAFSLVPRVAAAIPLLSSCPACDGSKYAISYSLESNDGTTATFDVTLWADTSGNNIPGGPHSIDAVAIGISLPAGASVDSVMDQSPSGDWTAQGGGLSNAACTGTGAFICAQAGTLVATGSPTIYSWTWDVNVPSASAAAFPFGASGDVKISYSDVNGHNVSDQFVWVDPPTQNLPPTVPEPGTLVMLGSGLIGAAAGLRRRFAR